ncbi:hypothetical protein K3495_g8459 [Podosphaera aphanis]|nr:hypothetical protein K3495_g8459 [Podosphaera aphanis]
MIFNAETSSYTQDVHDCLLEDSELEVLHEQMDNTCLCKSRKTCSSTRASRASKITECKWAISIIASNITEEPGQEKWFIRLGNTPEHNHGAVHASGLANRRPRARGNEVQVYLKNAITSGIDLKRARSLAYQQFAKDSDGENMFILKDLYNEKDRLR